MESEMITSDAIAKHVKSLLMDIPIVKKPIPGICIYRNNQTAIAKCKHELKWAKEISPPLKAENNYEFD